MIKKIDKKTGKETVVAATDASNIAVTDPTIVETPTSLNDVLKKISDDNVELRGNVKWLYKNGGTGTGSGGGGGGVATSTKFECTNNNMQVSGVDNIIYISEDKIILNYRIFQQKGSSKFNHSVYLNGTRIKNDESIVTNQIIPLTLLNLSTTETNTIRFTAYDEEGFNLTDYIVKIICGSISLDSTTVSNNGSISKYYGTGDIEVDFTMMNRIKGSSTVIEIKLNNSTDGMVKETFMRDGEVNYRLKIMEQLNKGQQLETGVSYTITAQAYTVLTQTIPSSVFSLTVSVMDNKSLIITVNGISEESVPDDDLNLKTYLQGSDLSFFYTLNAASYSSFLVAFEVLDARKNRIATIGSIFKPGVNYDPDDGHDLWEDNKRVSKGTNNNFSYSTNKIPLDKLGVIYVNMFAWTSDGTLGSGIGTVATLPIKTVKCKIQQVDNTIPNYTNNKNTLYVNMDCPQEFDSYQDKTVVKLPASVLDNQSKPIEITTKLELDKVNNVSSGFVKNSLTGNDAALRISGESHGLLDIDYFNDKNIGSWSLNGSGFTISLTFQSDLHPNANGTIFSYGTYDQDGEIVTGFDVSLEEAKCVYSDGGNMRTVKTSLVQGVKTTIDFVCEKMQAEKAGFVKIYLDGALTSVGAINSIDDVSFGKLIYGAYFGCKKVGSDLTNFCDVNIFNCRIYKASIDIPDIIINNIINWAYINKLSDGSFDWTSIDNIKSQNFISPKWICTLWDYTAMTPQWKSGSEVYTQISANPPLPVIMLNETNSTNLFHNMYNTSYNEANGKNAQSILAPCNMDYKDTKGNVIKITDMKMGLQGTSSMAYSAKNLELYFGDMANGQQRLFTPKDEWLPENQFTLKADVIDSAHANNVSIGKFVNSGYFTEIYPMKFVSNPYRAKVKHTLEGFPTYVFVKFGDNLEPTFLGIYNFNLGRGSNYNMGFEVLSNYKLVSEKAPSEVESYTKMVNPYKGGVFSFEFNTNSPTDIVAFQQPDQTIVNAIIDQRYPPIGDASQGAGWKRLYEMFNRFSRMYKTTNPPNKWIFDNNRFVETSEKLDAQLRPTMEYFEGEEAYINWDNANKYFAIAMALGMLDSLGKNMTLRSWDVNSSGTRGVFNTAFYDMDTALGLDNYGDEAVPNTVYIDYWYNQEIDGYTVASRIDNGKPEGVKGYDMPCSRLWEIVRNMIKDDPGNVESNYQTEWSMLRKSSGMLSSAKKFVDEYFLAHTKNVGSAVYNIDYSIKYLKKYKFQMDNGEEVIGYNDLKFLHGTRKNYVLQWLDKRLKYIDGCMNICGLYTANGESNQWVSAHPQSDFKDSPYVQQWSGRGNGSSGAMFEFEVLSNTPTMMCMSIATNTQRILLAENDTTTFKFKGTASSSSMSWNNTGNISKFKGFNQLNFATVGLFPMGGLLELDLSNMNSFNGTTETVLDIKALTQLRKLNLQNMKSAGNLDSGFIISVQNCLKLKTIDIRNSDVGTLNLPGNDKESIGAGVLSELLIAGSAVNSLKLQNQQFLKNLDFTNCKRLTSVDLDTLINLETITFSGNNLLQTVKISNCPKLKTVICRLNTGLTTFLVDTCAAVSDINLDECNNTALEININGAYNLKTLSLNSCMTKIRPILPSYASEISNMNFFSTLTTLNLTSSSIVGFDFGSTGVTSKYNGKFVMDLSHFTNLTSLILKNATGVEYIKFKNEPNNPYNLGTSFFEGCSSLKRVFGHVIINGTHTFNGCTLFYVHEPEMVNGVTVDPSVAFRGTDTSTPAGMEAWTKDTNLQTNITIGTTDISYCFSSTGVTAYDLYYILKKSTNVRYMEGTFSTCNNIVTSVTDPLKRTTFNNNGLLISINSIFSRSTRMSGVLYSPQHDDAGNIQAYNGLLSPLVNLTGLDSSFYGCSFQYMDEYFFWQLNSAGAKLKITSLNTLFYNYNPCYILNTGNLSNLTAVAAKVGNLLKHLPELSTIRYYGIGNVFDFDSTTVSTPSGNVTYCNAFFNTPKLVSVTNSFTSITAKGTWENLFGGQQYLIDTYPTKFPQNFSEMRNSFVVTSIISGGRMLYPLRNDMFHRIKKTITRLSGAGDLEITYSGCLYGAEKTFQPENNDGEVFPFSIFEGCSKLIECPGFFYRLTYTPPEVLSLPGNVLFKDTVALENLSYAFNSLGVTNKFSLSGKGFINCNLKKVAYIFAGNGRNITGNVPYGLFYMESNLTKSIKGWFEDNDENVNELFGFDDSGNYIPSAITPTPKTLQISYKAIKKTIVDMSHAIEGLNSAEMRPYTFALGGMTNFADSGNLVTFNEKYNNVKFVVNSLYNVTVPKTIKNPNYDLSYPESTSNPVNIKNPDYDDRRIVSNQQYDNFYRMWNEYCVDGSNIKEQVEQSGLYWSGLLPQELPSSYYDEANMRVNGSASGKWNTMNYLVPPDLFLYCQNAAGTNVDYCIAGANSEGNEGDDQYGLYGRIPPRLFDPVYLINNLRGVFSGLIYVVPYYWKYTEGINNYPGSVYPPELLKKCGTNLKNISYLFANNHLRAECVVHQDTFRYNTQLQFLSGLWQNANWMQTGTDIIQLPSILFSGLNSIIYIDRMFGNGTSEVDAQYGRGPKIIDKTLFNANQKNIANIAYFMNHCLPSTGTIPEFWKYTNMSAPDIVCAYNGLYSSKISNLVDARNSKYASAATNPRD